ncbi:MAG: hypothetical protein PHD95_03105 [Candidatus ainarchaeum sp.]|nr:hypothetical protein [Candidatus ainarchaeum sp.]
MTPRRRRPVKKESLAVSWEHGTMQKRVTTEGSPLWVGMNEAAATKALSEHAPKLGLKNIRIVRSSTGRQVSMQHIPQKKWDAIFKKKKK